MSILGSGVWLPLDAPPPIAIHQKKPAPAVLQQPTRALGHDVAPVAAHHVQPLEAGGCVPCFHVPQVSEALHVESRCRAGQPPFSEVAGHPRLRAIGSVCAFRQVSRRSRTRAIHALSSQCEAADICIRFAARQHATVPRRRQASMPRRRKCSAHSISPVAAYRQRAQKLKLGMAADALETKWPRSWGFGRKCWREAPLRWCR
jgi:hypothetical protein